MPLTDEDLIQLVRAQMAGNINRLGYGQADLNEELQRSRQKGASSIAEQMTPEEWDYYVDITREDLPEINPDTGKPRGWKKKVHRYTTKKGEELPPPGKKRSGSR